MRAVWVDAGNDADIDLLRKHGITRADFPLSEAPQVVRRRILLARTAGLVTGVYAAWNWYPGLSGPQFAEKVDALLRQVAPDATNTWPKVGLNDETHDPQRILALLARWRELRPRTDTNWSMEGMQGGWMDPAFVAQVVSRRVRLGPQAYGGVGGRIDYGRDPLLVARDLTKRGFPDVLVSPYYDAARLDSYAGWDGWAYTQGRLT